eukprot:3554949-Prymnesium_polylepis.1
MSPAWTSTAACLTELEGLSKGTVMMKGSSLMLPVVTMRLQPCLSRRITRTTVRCRTRDRESY